MGAQSSHNRVKRAHAHQVCTEELLDVMRKELCHRNIVEQKAKMALLYAIVAVFSLYV